MLVGSLVLRGEWLYFFLLIILLFRRFCVLILLPFVLILIAITFYSSRDYMLIAGHFKLNWKPTQLEVASNST